MCCFSFSITPDLSETPTKLGILDRGSEGSLNPFVSGLMRTLDHSQFMVLVVFSLLFWPSSGWPAALTVRSLENSPLLNDNQSVSDFCRNKVVMILTLLVHRRAERAHF